MPHRVSRRTASRRPVCERRSRGGTPRHPPLHVHDHAPTRPATHGACHHREPGGNGSRHGRQEQSRRRMAMPGDFPPRPDLEGEPSSPHDETDAKHRCASPLTRSKWRRQPVNASHMGAVAIESMPRRPPARRGGRQRVRQPSSPPAGSQGGRLLAWPIVHFGGTGKTGRGDLGGLLQWRGL